MASKSIFVKGQYLMPLSNPKYCFKNLKFCTEVSQHKRKRTSRCAFQSAEKIFFTIHMWTTLPNMYQIQTMGALQRW